MKPSTHFGKRLRDAIVCCALLLALPGCVHYQASPLPSIDSTEQTDARSLGNPALRDFLVSSSGHQVKEWPPHQLDFEQLALVAFFYHPSLDVARAQWRVSLGSMKTANGRPNPVVSAQPGYNFSSGGGLSPWFPGVNLDWPIETAGKRGYRVARATFLAEAARLSLFQNAWQVRASLRAALLDLTAAEQREALLRRQQEAQLALIQVLQQRLNAGTISKLEFSQVQLTTIRTGADLAEAHRQSTESRGRVAEWLGVPLVQLSGVTLQLNSGVTHLPPASESASQLRGLALRQRADLRALLAEYRASESTLQLEIAKQYPDIHLGTGYQWDQGDSKWTLGVSLELPVLNRNQGPITEAIARRAEAAAKFNALQSKIIADVDRLLEQRRSTQAQVVQASELMSAHQQQLKSMRAAFEAGGADQVEIRTAEIEAAAAELVRLDAWSKAQMAEGELEQTVQTPLLAAGWLEHPMPSRSRSETP